MLVHGFARGALGRIIRALHAAYFTALLVADVVVVKRVLLRYRVGNTQQLRSAVISLHRLSFGECFVHLASYVHALVSKYIQAHDLQFGCTARVM